MLFDNDEAFSNALRAHGRPLRVDELPTIAANGLKEQLTFYRLVAPFVHCGFLNNTGFNAVATSYAGQEFIGIYLGAILLIARYSYALLSDPTMFAAIGDASAEHVDLEIIMDLRRPSEPVQFPFARYLPRDPVRLRAAQHLAMCAYAILFCHELAHLELCHLKLISDELPLAEYQELMSLPLSEEQALLIRTLEWDADNSALMTALKIWRRLYTSLDYSAITPLGPVRSWFIAAQLLFWVMDFVQPRRRAGLLATHPSPHARLVSVFMHMDSFGFVPDAPTERERQQDSLLPWIINNDFPSRIIAETAANAPIDGIVQELVEVRNNYERIMPRLLSYQADRLRGRGVHPPVFPGVASRGAS